MTPSIAESHHHQDVVEDEDDDSVVTSLSCHSTLASKFHTSRSEHLLQLHYSNHLTASRLVVLPLCAL